MWQNVIGAHIRRTTRNLIISSVLILLTLGLVFWVSQRYLYNCFRGPFRLDRQTLFNTTDPARPQKYFVTVQGDSSLDTGIVEKEEQEYWVTTESRFHALQLGTHFLIVKSPTDKVQDQVTGSLAEIPTDVEPHLADFRNELNSQLHARYPDVQIVFMPYMVDATSFRTDAYWELSIGGVFLFVAIANLLKAQKRLADFNTHPVAQALAPYGLPADVANTIDTEFKMGPQKIGPALFTNNWLLKPSPFGLDVVRLDDIVWAYEKVTQHRTNGIPTSKTYAAVLYDRNKKATEISGKKPKVEEILAKVTEKTPWILTGFSAELAKQWKADPNVIIDAVEAQRRQSGL